MYRNTASISGGNIASSTQFLSPRKSNDDTDLDVSVLLEQKRRDLDEEVAQYKAAKDKEFLEFEKALRKPRQKRKKEQKSKKDSSGSVDPAPKVGALSLLAGATKPDSHVSGNSATPAKGTGKTEGGKKTRPAPLSKATISLDRKNIKGQTTPPEVGSSPTEQLSKQISTSPRTELLAYTPPRCRSARGPTPSALTKESHDSFAGVFTPSYLPLLESKASKDTSMSQLPDIKLQRANSFSNSQASSDLLSPVSRSQRSQTAPILPSTSLPSALRTATDTAVRKRKHVTFQLADSAIVEPSSSYEELPSPEPREESRESLKWISEVMTNGQSSNEQQPEEDSDSGLMPPGDWSQKKIRSPKMKGKEKGDTANQGGDPDLSPRSLEIETDDGGSGVGFFELDEEIASPGFGEVRPFDADEVDDLNDENAERRRGHDDRDDMHTKQTYDYSGSVPINIGKPSSSWVGSFGH